MSPMKSNSNHGGYSYKRHVVGQTLSPAQLRELRGCKGDSSTNLNKHNKEIAVRVGSEG